MRENIIFPVDQWFGEPHGRVSQERLETEGSTAKRVVRDSAFAISNDTCADAEQLVTRIENTRTDITVNYADWVDIAMALSTEFGESGLSLFKRISRFYPGYDESECEKLFESVQRNNCNKVHIGTLFHIAKNYGVEIVHKKSDNDSESVTKIAKIAEMSPDTIGTIDTIDAFGETGSQKDKIQNFASEVYPDLPPFLQTILQRITTADEMDMILLTAITVITSAMGKSIRGLYNNNWVYPNLYLMVVGNAGTKKGLMEMVRYLVEPIHSEYRNVFERKYAEYRSEVNELSNKGKQKQKSSDASPVKPKQMMHNIPVNSSAAAAFQALVTMHGLGLMFDTEIDTMVSTFKQDWGDFSELLRKNFHNETVEVYRKTDDDYYMIDEPAFSLVLSGTPNQALSLIKSSENGLFSRFMILMKEGHLSWIDVKNEDTNVDNKQFFKHLGVKLLGYWKKLGCRSTPVTFTLSERQWYVFNEIFKRIHVNYMTTEGEEVHASIVRLGHVDFRMMMVFSLLRILDEGTSVPDRIECDERDFRASMTIILSLVQHMAQFFEMLEPKRKVTACASSEETRTLVREDQNNLYVQLPESFSTSEFVLLAQRLYPQMSDTTIKRWLNAFLKRMVITKVSHGHYEKCE